MSGCFPWGRGGGGGHGCRLLANSLMYMHFASGVRRTCLRHVFLLKGTRFDKMNMEMGTTPAHFVMDHTSLSLSLSKSHFFALFDFIHRGFIMFYMHSSHHVS